MDVIFYEAFEEEVVALKKFLPSKIQVQFTAKTIQEAGDIDPPAPVISIRTQSRIPIAWADKIKGLLTRSQGYDHVSSYIAQTGAPVSGGYLGSYCSRAVAEQAVLMMLALMRRLPKQIGAFERFHRDGLTGVECKGKSVVVIGVGHIGSELVGLLKALGMVVRGVDIVRRVQNLEYRPLIEGVTSAEAVVCALPLTSETCGILGYDVLHYVKRGAVFINIARGEISPAADLKRLLDEGIFGGIALDVYPEESVLADCLRLRQETQSSEIRCILDFMKDDRVILTPHNAFNTRDAVENKATLSAESVRSFLDQGTFPRPIPGT